jgi:hypothetical protein
VGRSEVHGRNRSAQGRQNANIPAVVIMLLNDIKFVRIPVHVARMFGPALTTENAGLKSNVQYILCSSPNPGSS